MTLRKLCATVNPGDVEDDDDDEDDEDEKDKSSPGGGNIEPDEDDVAGDEDEDEDDDEEPLQANPVRRLECCIAPFPLFPLSAVIGSRSASRKRFASVRGGVILRLHSGRSRATVKQGHGVSLN